MKPVRWIIVLSLIAAMALAACGGKNDKDENSDAQSPSSNNAAPSNAAAIPANVLTHASYGDWTLVSVEDIRDKVVQAIVETYPDYAETDPEEGPLSGPIDFAPLSPDGTTIVVTARLSPAGGGDTAYGACAYTIDTGAATCKFTSEMQSPFAGEAATAVWSPDSSRLVFYEDLWRRNMESDLWLYEPAAGTLTNLTEDMQFRAWVGAENYQLDHMPLWDTTDSITFLRIVPGEGEGPRTVTLNRIAPLDGVSPRTITTLAELPEDTVGTIGLYARSVIAPSGSPIIVGRLPFKQPLSDGGFWTIDPATGALAPLVTSAALVEGLPAWLRELILPEDDDGTATELLIPASVAISADGQRLVFHTIPRLQLQGFQYDNFHSVDLASGELTSLIDYNQWASAEEFVSVTGGVQPSREVPRVGFLTPDGQTLIYMHPDQGDDDLLSIKAVPITLEGPAVSVLPGTLERDLIYRELARGQGLRSDILPLAANGRVLLGSTLITFE